MSCIIHRNYNKYKFTPISTESNSSSNLIEDTNFENESKHMVGKNTYRTEIPKWLTEYIFYN